MEFTLQRSSYEKLVAQMVYIEENMAAIEDSIMESGLGTSREDIRLFFEKYTKRVEALLDETDLDDNGEGMSRIPYIVLDSRFTLSDKNSRVYYCHLSSDNILHEKGSMRKIYFLSETGLILLLKKEGRTVTIDMGSGYMEHTISSIRIV